MVQASFKTSPLLSPLQLEVNMFPCVTWQTADGEKHDSDSPT